MSLAGYQKTVASVRAYTYPCGRYTVAYIHIGARCAAHIWPPQLANKVHGDTTSLRQANAILSAPGPHTYTRVTR